MEPDALSKRLLFVAGIGTWFAVGLPVWSSVGGGQPLDPNFWVWGLGYLGFGFFFIFETVGPVKRLRARFPLFSLVALTLLAALTQFAQPQYGLMAILFIITAVEAAYLLPFRQGMVWVLGQTGLVALSSTLTFSNPFAIVVQTMIYFGFQTFSLFSTYATLREAKARAELARLNAELRATQSLVSESSRMAERLRIARDLHDLIGHHLTALSLNLEVASHVAKGEAKEPIHQAQSLAKLLLSDVRDAVSTMREGESVDLRGALVNLVEGIPKPVIHLSVPKDLSLDHPERAHVIVRCVQEVITNTIKHAQAENLWIVLEYRGETLHVRAHDDGRGSPRVSAGNGLAGMRERLERVGGNLSVHSAQGQGFSLQVQVPI